MNAQILESPGSGSLSVAVLPRGAVSSPAVSTPSSRSAVSATSTPTRIGHSPSRSAASIPGEPQVDANTVALYHFDSDAGSQVIDATGRYTATLQGTASITSNGMYAGGLQVSPGGRVVTGYMGDFRQGTIEVFVDFKVPCGGTIGPSFPFVVAGPDPANGQVNLVLGSNNYAEGHYPMVSLSILVNGKWQTVGSNLNSCRYLVGYNPWAPYWPYDIWRYHHVAGTWGPRGMEIWVDGVLHGLNTSAPVTCNPQEQIWGKPYNSTLDYGQVTDPPWWGYPNCPFPVFSNSAAPGTYTGSLPGYNVFQIGGCAPGMQCLNGTLDEVRISNVQRVLSSAVIPTTTPTPSPTPVRIGAYGVDQYTLALYPMDLVDRQYVYDEVTHEPAKADHNLTLGAGRYNSAVLLDGGNGIAIGNPGQPFNGTVEAWVNLANDADFVTIFNGKRSAIAPGNDVLLGKNFYHSQNLIFAISDDITWHIADSGIKPSALVGSWHHIAGTWGGAGLQIWIDGQLKGTAPYYGRIGIPEYTFILGCDPVQRCMAGLMDEFRYSSVQRAFVAVPTPTPSPTATPVFSALPAAVATTSVQASAPGLTIDYATRLNGLLDSDRHGSSQPSDFSLSGRFAAVSSGLTPAAAPAAAIAIPQLPVPANTPPGIASSLSLKTNSLSVDQPLALDANAIALYRLNSQYGITLSDATGNNPALLFGDATIKSQGEERPALLLNGGLSYAQATHFKSPRSGSVEVWANFQSNQGQMTIVAARQNNAPRFLLGVRADENLSLGFGLYQAGWQWADSGLTLRALGSGWHHLAGTWGPRGVEIWIDGILRGVNPYPNGLSEEGDSTLLIGWSPGSAGMNGQISQIRISNTQRTY